MDDLRTVAQRLLIRIAGGGLERECVKDTEPMEQERRRHRRLPIQLPLICRAPDALERILVRSKTVNVSTGGLYFETLSDEVQAGQRLELELTVPPGDGHFPYQGRVTANARVIRVTDLPAKSSAEGLAHLPRRGVAATFSTGLRLSF